jgi:hypothetical protein
VGITVLIAGKLAVMALIGPWFGLPKLAAIRAGLLLAPGEQQQLASTSTSTSAAAAAANWPPLLPLHLHQQQRRHQHQQPTGPHSPFLPSHLKRHTHTVPLHSPPLYSHTRSPQTSLSLSCPPRLPCRWRVCLRCLWCRRVSRGASHRPHQPSLPSGGPLHGSDALPGGAGRGHRTNDGQGKKKGRVSRGSVQVRKRGGDALALAFLAGGARMRMHAASCIPLVHSLPLTLTCPFQEGSVHVRELVWSMDANGRCILYPPCPLPPSLSNDVPSCTLAPHTLSATAPLG